MDPTASLHVEEMSLAVLTKRIHLRVAGKLSHSTKDLCVMGRRELGNEWVGLDRSLDVK